MEHPPPIGSQILTIYDYTDEQGRLLFQVVRLQPKTFRQRRPDGRGGWLWNLEGVWPVLYRLPDVLNADTAIVFEGERDAETAVQLGLPAGWAATSSPFGSGQWRTQYSEALAGKRVLICPDTDRPGQLHLQQVGLALRDKATEIKVITLPPGVKDLTEWVEKGGQADQFALLIQQAKQFDELLPDLAIEEKRRVTWKKVAQEEPPPSHSQIVTTYDYTDEQGNLLFQVVRLHPKSFRERCPDGQGGWRWHLGGIRLVLYHLADVLEADTVLVLEGEKDADTARQLGLPVGWAATSNPLGPYQWREDYSEALRGKRVFLCLDTDRTGQRQLKEVGLALIGKAREIKVVNLPSDVKDLTEWVERGGDANQFALLLAQAIPFEYPRLDTELKQNIRPLEKALEKLMQLRGVIYEWKEPEKQGNLTGTQIGFLAQEVAAVFPEWVGDSSDGYKTLTIMGFEALTVEAFKELKAEQEALQARCQAIAVKMPELALISAILVE
ncbi:MAG: tail fiber domain-containing protein [Microcystis sp.]|jgi:5S rRNA maturation endonuclease (ribonuclease M5)|uniref:tail fiber domain-containing protein n=1 Tax=Microcystis sp. LE19-84.1B TaxID=3016438 RepID=UPI0022BD3414|nr:tail fiber domain-containing protein [Microcystis sp. LE19-84.1B]MCZ8222594.1 tail fiber domain-containing protein [Microcystis sp. LE19-84.1B]